MHVDRDFEFSVSMLEHGRWIITAHSREGVATMLAGLYVSRDAALGALSVISKAWLNSHIVDGRDILAA